MRAADRADEVRRRYGQQGVCDLGAILQGEGLIVEAYPFSGGVKEVIYKKHIGISREYWMPRDRRVLVAHALGHWFIHCGNGLYYSLEQPVVATQRENEANVFAKQLLMPEALVIEQITRFQTIDDLAEHYSLPLWFVAERTKTVRERHPEISSCRSLSI